MDASGLTVDSIETYRGHVESAAAFLEEQASPVPSLGIILDPALKGLGDGFAVEQRVSTGEVPHLPDASAATDPTLSLGMLNGVRVAVFDGPLSLYEGYTPREVVFPIRMFGVAGVDTLLFVTTAGSLRSELAPKDLVLVSDHINFQGANPLVGPNISDWGPRFPDMSEAYSASLRKAAEASARSLGLPVRQGVYFAMIGPQEATRAEYRMAKTVGADLVGTSTVPEVIAARHMGLDVLAVSIVTHRCIPFPSPSRSSDEREAVVESVRSDVYSLLHGTLGSMKSEEKPV